MYVSVPARIASFGGTIRVGLGRGALLLCSAVGLPAPRTRWAHARAPVTHHRFYQVTRNGHLHIRGELICFKVVEIFK